MESTFDLSSCGSGIWEWLVVLLAQGLSQLRPRLWSHVKAQKVRIASHLLQVSFSPSDLLPNPLCDHWIPWKEELGREQERVLKTEAESHYTLILEVIFHHFLLILKLIQTILKGRS
jgi:hypothetical protein